MIVCLRVLQTQPHSYMVEVTAISHSRSSNQFLVGFQHVSYMARQGGRVQLEQSEMRLALNMAKMAKEVFSHTAIEETQQLIKKPNAEVREENKRGIVFARHNKARAAIERHPAMVRENLTDGCLPYQDGTAMNPQTHRRCKETGAPPPRPVPPRHGTPLAPPNDSEITQSTETEGVPPGYVYIHSLLPCARFVNLDPYAKDLMRDKDFIPDLLTDEGPFTS